MEQRHTKTTGAKKNLRMLAKKQVEPERLKLYMYFLLDLIPIIKENLADTKNEERTEYNKGKVFAYFDVLSVIQQQSETFGIDLKELGLDYNLLSELNYVETEKTLQDNQTKPIFRDVVT